MRKYPGTSGRETAGFDRLCETRENRAPLPHGGARFYCGLRAWHSTTANALLFPASAPAKPDASAGGEDGEPLERPLLVL